MRSHRMYFVAGILCGPGLLGLYGKRAAADDEKAKAAETKQFDISKLTNDELLKQAHAILAKASGDYLAAVRALAGIEARLEDASTQLEELSLPKSQPRKVDDRKVKDTINE